jgi:hypothetical protein
MLDLIITVFTGIGIVAVSLITLTLLMIAIGKIDV